MTLLELLKKLDRLRELEAIGHRLTEAEWVERESLRDIEIKEITWGEREAGE